LPAIWLKVLVVALVVWPFVFLCRLPVSDGNTVIPLPSENIEKKVAPKNN
jgi:hypothetical protein